MEEISVEGKKYLKAKLVARELGYTADYVGQLCRSGKVDAQLVGRTWYVDPNSIKGHKGARHRSTKVTTQREIRAELKKTLHQQQLEKEHFYHHKLHRGPTDIKYETDETDLLPKTIEKPKNADTYELPVRLADAKAVEVDTHTEKEYNFEAAEREEAKFYGTLRVKDYVTEVKVGGEEEVPKSVKVTGKQKSSHHPVVHKAEHERSEKPKKLRIDNEEKTEPLMPEVKKPVPQPEVPPTKMHIAIPVDVDEEELPIPVSYHIFTASSFVMALIIAAMCIGLEATVTADAQSLTTEYAFTVEHLSAQLYDLF